MITELLKSELKKENISLAQFQRLLQRVLDLGVLSRDESQVEAELYDTYLRVKSLVDDFLGVMGIRILHDSRFQYLRLFPPGAKVPGLEDDDGPAQGFRQRVGQQEVALILVLRNLHEQQLQEGKIDDMGCSTVSAEAISIAMKSLLKRSLPPNATDRKNLFRKVKQMRLIKYQFDEDQDFDDFWLKIRPAITSVVSGEVLASLCSEEQVADSQASQERDIPEEAVALKHDEGPREESGTGKSSESMDLENSSSVEAATKDNSVPA